MKALRLAMIALVACTMVTFTSCNNNNGGDDPKPDNGVKEGTAQVTFGDLTWPVALTYCQLGDYQGQEYLHMEMFSDAPGTMPMALMTIGSTTGKHMASTDQFLSFQYYTKMINVNGQNGYGDWWSGNLLVSCGSVSCDLTAFDANSLTITLKATGEVWYAPDYIQNSVVKSEKFVFEANKYKMDPMPQSKGEGFAQTAFAF